MKLEPEYSGRVGLDGQWEVINKVTGKVEFRQKSKGKHKVDHTYFKNGAIDYEVVLDAKGNRILVPKNFNPDHLSRRARPYAEVTKNLILQAIIGGATITSIGKIEGMPKIKEIEYWLTKYPDFQTEYDQAKKLRADGQFNKFLETVKLPLKTQTDIAAARFKAQVFSKAAHIGDPESFAPRQKIESEHNQNITYNINTGVPQKPKEIEVPSEEIKTIEDQADQHGVHSEGSAEDMSS